MTSSFCLPGILQKWQFAVTIQDSKGKLLWRIIGDQKKKEKCVPQKFIPCGFNFFLHCSDRCRMQLRSLSICSLLKKERNRNKKAADKELAKSFFKKNVLSYIDYRLLLPEPKQFKRLKNLSIPIIVNLK